MEEVKVVVAIPVGVAPLETNRPGRTHRMDPALVQSTREHQERGFPKEPVVGGRAAAG